MKWSNVYRIKMMFVIFVATIMIGGLVQAATVTVGSGVGYDFDSIQAGIDAAVDGDTVLVAPGEYIITEPITFRGKAITVKSEEGTDETTIRMGTPADTQRASVVLFENGETVASVLDGFTITGGRGTGEPDAGGGIGFNASSGTIRNCAIVQNTSTWGGGICGGSPCSPALINCTIAENSCVEDGGGVISIYGCSMTLTNCIIRGNSNTGFENGGGGVSAHIDSFMTMTDCIVSGNSSKYVGGGVHVWEASLVDLTRCTIVSNTADSGTGGGVFTANSCTTLTNCVIARNTAQMGGGGVLSLFADDFITISNCTIWGNEGGGVYGGGGICCIDQASATVTNSIFWANTAPKGREISILTGAEFDVSYSDVAGGQAEISVEGGSTLDCSAGNIDADPYFVDPTNDDFHLKSQAGRWNSESHTWVQDDVTSPCVDAGDPMSPIDWEFFPNGGFVNMGAYGGTVEASKTYFGEPICETIVAGDINGDGQVNRADLEIMALHWTDDIPLPLP